MQLVAHIPAIVVNQSNLVDKKTGEALREQSVLIHATGKMSGIEAKILLNAGEEPLKVGKYDISGDSIQAGRYGSVDFKLNRRHLSPLVEEARKAA